MNADFFKTVSSFKFTSRRHRISDDDAIDRINSFYTPVIIIILSTIIGAKMYVVGDPIQCWIPPEFKDGWEQFAENYCWVKNTYFVKPNEEIPDHKNHRADRELTYYQWVPFVLALQALMFYIPGTVWKLLNWQSGIHIKSLVSMAIKAIDGDPQKRDDELKCLSRHVGYALSSHKSSKPSTLLKIKRVFLRVFLCGHTKTGNYLTFIYMIVKLLYIVNVVGQFFILNAFLKTDYSFYGIGVLKDLIAGRDWQHSGHFPRVTMCDFDIRVIGNTHPRSLQCVLVINLFNEKVYIFLWFWFFFVAAITILDALRWFGWSMFPFMRYKMVKKFVHLADEECREKHQLFPSGPHVKDQFVYKYLYSDGALVMRLISKNAGEPVVQDLVQHLWFKYVEQDIKKEKDRNYNSNRQDEKPLLGDITKGDSKGHLV